MSTSHRLQINAAFLMLMGGGAAVADAVGHFFNRGPLAAAMFRALSMDTKRWPKMTGWLNRCWDRPVGRKVREM